MKKQPGSSSRSSGEQPVELQHLDLNHGGQLESLTGCFVGALTRKKPLDCRTVTHLNRCLSLLDLTALGVGSTLGLGLYVLAGQVASTKAGPAVVISFALAALASAFSALCYAEFAGRIPQAGSAYAYSYITVGEFAAFVIGWNLVLEYVIGASTVARGFSSYLSTVIGQVQRMLQDKHEESHTSNSTLPPATTMIESSPAMTHSDDNTLLDEIIHHLVYYFDGVSVLIVVATTLLLICGVKGSSKATLAFTAINLTVVAVLIGSSFKYLDINYWRLHKSQVPAGHGEGGFMPYGWSGVLAGSATCFFGFIGFDTIASSAEEARSPRRNVPIAIILSLAISSAVYMAIASVQTLIWPYYDQNKVTILPYIFQELQLPFTYWVVSIGALAGLASSQLGGIIPLPRILYSMAQDCLIYHPLAKVEPRTKTPMRATLIGSSLVAILACLFDIEALADMVSIGTLAAYSIVSLSVLILRYQSAGRKQIDDSTILTGHLNLSDIVAANQAARLKELKIQNSSIERKHSKLASRESTPIRVKGSKSLNPQLSVGFQSWFKPRAEQQEEQERVTREEALTSIEEDARQHASTSGRNWCWRLLGARYSAGTGNEDGDSQVVSGKQSGILITMDVLLAFSLSLVGKRLLDLNGGATNEPLGREDASLVTQLSWAALILAGLLGAVMIALSRLPVPHEDDSNSSTNSSNMFTVPLVPLIPTLSILVNLFLMLNLSYLTWVRFVVWMSVGMFIYFTYGIFNSRGYLLHLHK